MGKTRPASPQLINIKGILEVNCLKQRELADLINVHAHVVNRWCRGFNINTKFQLKIRKALIKQGMIIVKKDENTIDISEQKDYASNDPSQNAQPVINDQPSSTVQDQKEEVSKPHDPMLESKCKCGGRMVQTKIEVDPSGPEQGTTPQEAWIFICLECGERKPIY